MRGERTKPIIDTGVPTTSALMLRAAAGPHMGDNGWKPGDFKPYTTTTTAGSGSTYSLATLAGS